MYSEHTKYVSREEWLEARRSGIGGSDAPVVAGVDKYSSRLELWSDKTHRLPPSKVGEPAEWGRKLESLVLEELASRTGRRVEPQSHLIVRHPETDWLICSPDAFQTDPRRGTGIVQAKTASAWLDGEWKDSPPLPYQVQIQHEMLATGVGWGTLCVLIGGQRFRYYDVERNDRFLDQLMEQEADFWHLVVNQVPPDPDETESCKRTLSALYGDGEGSIELPDEAASWDALLLGVKEQMKLLETAKRRLENQLRSAIGEASVGVLPSGVTYAVQTINRKAYEVKESSYQQLTRRKARKGA